AFLNVVHRDFLLVAIVNSVRSFRCKTKQRFDRKPGSTPRFRLDQLPQQDQSRNNRCRFKIKIDFSLTPERNRKNARRDSCNGAVEICCSNANGDERKHVEAAINNRLPCACKEKAARPKDYWCC